MSTSVLFSSFVMKFVFSPKRNLLVALLPLSLCLATDLFNRDARAHGAGGGEAPLPAGQFRALPVITIEGHGGFENNLEGRPQHYAIDGMFGVVLEWGLPNNGSFTLEAQLGPALVWGEAEHFYGRVHVESDHDDHNEHASEHEDEHDDHASEHEDDHDDHASEHEHDDHEDHASEHEDEHDDHASEHGDEHDDHDNHAEHTHAHGSGAPFRRTDIKGFLQALYQPNDRLALSVAWEPYYVTGDEGEDFGIGLKNELGAEVVYAFGDGDVNFALGDGLESVIDGVFVSVENRSGWESDGTFIGNYTDPWLGFGFNIDLLNVTLSGGPRFYTPGSYSGLPQRTDWGGEIELEYPIAENVVLFAHWEPVYSTEGGPGWGVGWQHHVGTGLSLLF